MVDRDEYCKDCDRSIYAEHPSCDVNIENNGKYVMADDVCYCKIVNGKAIEIINGRTVEIRRKE